MLRIALCLLLALLAAPLAGCGSGAAASGGDDMASVVPRGALLYAQATIRPSGDTRDGALAAAGRILHTTDPAAAIRDLVGEAIAGDGQARIDFARDIEPWVGDRAAFWLDAPPRAGADPSGAAVVAVRDESQARAKIEELVRRGGGRLTQRDDYEVTDSGDAFAVRDGYAYFGEQAAVHRALATDSHLADEDSYSEATSRLPDGPLATYFVDMPRLFDAVLADDPQAAQARSALGPALEQPIAGAFTATAERLTIEQVTHGGDGSLAGPMGLLGGPSTPLLKEMPGDSWAAVGLPAAGRTLRAWMGAYAGALGGMAIESRLRQELGLDLERDVFSWMGDAAVFVRGTAPDRIDGALVVQVTDEARAAQAFGKLVGLARTRGGLDPEPVRVPGADSAFDLGADGGELPAVLARGHGRVVLAYGREAAGAALAPSSRLGDSALYRSATDALQGYDPSLVVSMPTVVSLLSGDSDIADAKPYLEAFDVIASGAQREGDDLRSRLAGGLRP